MATGTSQVSTCSPYEMLGLASNPTKAEIRKAYLALSLRYHPDKNNGGAHEIFVAIKAAYNTCIREADKQQNKRRRETGSGESASSHFDYQPSSPPPPPPSASWPSHQRRTTPPGEFSPLLHDFDLSEPLTYDDVLSMHNKYLDHLAAIQTLAASINRQFLAKKLIKKHPETCRAAEYVGRWLLAETREHKDLFAFLQKKRWWQKRRAELARRQAVWYVGKLSVGEELLKKIHHWLQVLMLHHVSQCHPTAIDDERLFIKYARQYCPEDAKDRKPRE